MDEVKYTSNNIKVLEEALSTVIDDLESFYQIGVLEKIYVHAPLPGFSKCEDNYTLHNWYLIIDKTGIYLKQGDDENYRTYHFARRKPTGKLKKFLTINEQDIIFLNNYDKIRENVVQKIESAIESRAGNVENAQKIIRRYKKEATIEIELPETINKHTIEVTEENGQKIGTLSFGGISLRIITDASIEFKNKNKNEKIKRK